MIKQVEIEHHKPGPVPENARSILEMEFGTIKGARSTLENIAEGFTSGRISERQSRALVYIYNSILSALKLEADMRIEERLDAIEEKLSEHGKHN